MPEDTQTFQKLSISMDIKELVDALPAALFIKDSESKILLMNKACEEQWGLSFAELQDTDASNFFPPEQMEWFLTKDREVFASGQKIDFEESFWNSRLQENRIGHTFKKPIYDITGKPHLLICITIDVTERKRIEDTMRLASWIYQSSNEAIVVTDENNRIVEINAAFTRITGYELEEIKGKDPKCMQSGMHDTAFYQQFWQTIQDHGHWQGEMWDRKKNGTLMAKWLNISVIRKDDGSIYRYIGQFSDITERKEKDELIWRQANFDTLTNLPNRRLFRDRLEQEIKKAHRTNQKLCLFFIDLDKFKDINDTLGHDKGDILLIEAAQRIQRCIRETDTVARLGGDEFTIILPEFDSLANIERIAQCIIRCLSTPFEMGTDRAYLSASIGITIYPDDTSDLEGLLKHADQAMYLAKDQGRNRFAYFTESMQRNAEGKRALTNDLRHALERGELVVYYQPIVDLKTGQIVKAEALLRWFHPARGMISPIEFIPLAEESGLIFNIGNWVFQQAVAAVERWRTKVGRLIQISVNKSPLQFSEKSTCYGWPEELRKLGLPDNSITVEITESILIKDSPRVKQHLLEFRRQGIEVSIDDFGTGFSSLSYLKQFDIDFLKIDRAFINNLAEDKSDKALTEAIIVMAHKLDIQTIAEGIETTAQRDMLIQFGCDYAQGYLFSRPISVDDFEKLLE